MIGEIEKEIINCLKNNKPMTIRQLSIKIKRENSYSFVLRKCNQLRDNGIIKMESKIVNINNKDMLVKMVEYI